jgi:hypothetical protein
MQLLEKLTVAQLVEKLTYFTESWTAACSYPERNELIPQTPIMFCKISFNIILPLTPTLFK